MEESTDRPRQGEMPKVLAPEGWTNAPDVMALKKDLTASKGSHDIQRNKIDGWLDNLHIRGKAKPKPRKGFSEAQPRMIQKQAEWRYPSLSEPFLSTPDLFKAAGRTWEDTQAAFQNQLILNQQFNTDIDRVAFIDEYVRAAVDEGTAIVKVGWEFEEEEITKVQSILDFRINPEMGPLYEELTQMKQSNPTGYLLEVPEDLKKAHDVSMSMGQPMEPMVVGEEEVTVFKTVFNRPTLEVCDYRNVIIDPSCKGDLSKANFVIYSFPTSLSNLRKDKRYKNLEYINVTTNSPLGDPDYQSNDASDFNFSDEPRKSIIVFEYWGFWDYDDSGIAKPIVASWVGDVLIRLESNPFPDKALPFIAVPLRPVKHSVYGEPDGELLEDNQRISGAVTRGIIDILGRSANGQMGYRKDALDATNRRKFQNGQDYEYNPGVDPRMAFYMHQFPEIPTSAQFILQQQQMEAESMTGVKAFSQGIDSGSLGEVAAGIRGALDAASKREMSILRRLANGIVKIGYKIASMNAEFLEDEEIIRITNESFIKIRREELAGKFDLSLSVSTAEEDNAKAQELAFMLQTMGNNADPAMTRLILRDIARLRKMHELAKEIENFVPEPDPMQQQMQMLEMMEKEANIAKINAEAGTKETQAILNQAKAITEQARARLMGSQADKSDLDFIEQESGVTQERNKELQGEQARANTQLKIVDHALGAERDQQKLLAQYMQKNSAI